MTLIIPHFPLTYLIHPLTRGMQILGIRDITTVVTASIRVLGITTMVVTGTARHA